MSTYNSSASKRPQPVAIAQAISAAIPTVVGFLVAIGALDLTPASAGDVSTAGQQIVAAVLTIASLVVAIVSTVKARAKVTPLASPRTINGEALVRASRVAE